MALTGLTKIQKVGINTATIPTLGGSENVGVVTATNFIGDGSGLTGVTGSGSGVIVRDGGSLVGTAGTINFGTNLNVSAISAGIVTVTNAASATALTNLSDVTISSASNGQILKHNGSVFVNTAETNTTYSQSSVGSGSDVNLRLTDSDGTNDDILITAGSNITFSSVTANGFTIAASGGGGGGGLSNVVEDTTPQLGGSLDLNNKFITGSGGINVSGVTTSTSFVGALTGNADTATTATNVTVSANNSTDETVYPIFVDGATGAQGAESDTGLSYNPSSGNLTATKFTGSGVSLTGVVTSIVAGANITLTGGPTGIVTIASSGGGGGGSGLSLANGVDNRVVTATGSTSLNGEPNLTWDGTTLAVTGNQTVSQSVVVGTAVTINSDGINGTSGVGITAYDLKANNQLIVASGIYGSSRLMFSGGSGSDLSYFAGGTAYSNHIFKLMQGGSTIERFRVSVDGGSLVGVMTATSFSGLNGTGIVVSGVSTFHNNIIGTATTATTVTLTANNGNSAYRVPFASANTGNISLYSDTSDGMTYNPSTGALSVNGSVTAGSFVKSGGSSSQFLKADGSIDSNTYLTSGSYLENVVEDTTPQLGGNLDLNSKNITGTGNAEIVGVITATSAVPTWTLGASGTDHYTFIGNGFTSATNDPDIYLVRGQRYAFLNNSGGNHPFRIQSDTNSTLYTSGVTNNNASSGYITFNVPMDAPAHLYYKCGQHPNMLGNIYIVGQHLANGADNRVLTATSAYGMNGESALTFANSGSDPILTITNSGNPQLRLTTTSTTDNCTIDFGDGDAVNRGRIVYTNNGDNMLFYTNGTSGGEKLKLYSNGRLNLSTQQSITSDTMLHVEAPSGVSSGETNVMFEGNSTMGARLNLKNNNTGSGANNQINFCDAGGQSTSAIIGYNTDQGNNYGDLAFATRDQSGAPPTERLRINKSGAIGIAGANYGSSGQVLTSNGSGSAVSWATPMSVLISSTTVSSQVSSVTFTEALTGAFSTYGIYIVTINGMRLANDDRDLHCRIRTGTNGATQLSSNDYISMTNGPSADEAFSATSQWRLNYNNIGNEIASGYQRELFNAIFYFYGFEANKRCRYHGQSTYQSSDGNIRGQFVNGVVTDASATTGLEFFSSSGNIALGKFSLFGVNG